MIRGSMQRRLIAAGVSLVLTLLSSSFASSEGHGPDGAPGKSKLSRALLDSKQGGSDELIDVIVTFKPGTQAAVKGLGPKLGGRAKGSLSKLPFQTLQIPASALEALAANPAVEFVSPDSTVYAASPAARETARVPGSATASNSQNQGWRGAGVTVAVVDTGVYPHADFYALAGQLDFVNGKNAVPMSPSDPYGHGTHVAGMIGADGRNSYQGKFQGVGTQAHIVSLRALDPIGKGSVSDVLRALDWLVTTGIPQGVRVVNLSMGKSVDDAQVHDPLVAAVEAVWDAGAVVVVSAGNYGKDGHYTITSPGNARKVITVGSLTDNATGTNFDDDYVSTFSSRGPTNYDKVL